LSGIGWIIFCSKTGLRLTGSFWERSLVASSYQAEMLGLCALHLFARALLEFHKIQEWKATLCCDIKRALELSSYACRRIRPSTKCVDILRSLKATKCTFTGKFTYVHVYRHMDRYLLWHQSSPPQQLNFVWDTLAKHAVTLAMTEGSLNRPTQLLPKEDVAVVIWGNKITDDISHTIRFQASKEEARKYWGNKKKNLWPSKRSDKVDWEHLNLHLKINPTCTKSGEELSTLSIPSKHSGRQRSPWSTRPLPPPVNMGTEWPPPPTTTPLSHMGILLGTLVPRTPSPKNQSSHRAQQSH
jgi:hypothetical protein